MSEYTEGICGDGAAILRDGERMTIGEVVNALNDYTALLARHNALVEAVKKEHLAFDALDDAGFQLGPVGNPIWTDHDAARAEVDRLIAEAGCDK